MERGRGTNYMGKVMLRTSYHLIVHELKGPLLQGWI